MNRFSVQVTYRVGKPLAAYIYLRRKPGQRSARTERVSAEVLVDYAADGSPLGIEIVSPAHTTLEEINQAFDRIGLERPQPRELQPLGA
jgi:uncharacterized protein YuzE